MNLSVKCEYAPGAIFELAVNCAGSPVKIGQMAKRRGVGAGYLLAHSPEPITVGEASRGGARAEGTPFTDVWRQVDDAVNRIFDRTNLADVVRDWTERSQSHAPGWTI